MLFSGCAVNLKRNFARDFSKAVLNQDDPATVRDGVPAYLLLLDTLLQGGGADDADMLVAAGKLHGAYAAVFVNNPWRANRMAIKAKKLARLALCQRHEGFCDGDPRSFYRLTVLLSDMTLKDLPALYTYGVTWAGWIKSTGGSWMAMAELPKVEAIIQRVVDLDSRYERGRPHLFLGVMNTLIPPAIGGKPEIGRRHFEKAIAISRGRDFQAKIQFAESYAKLVFNKKLYIRLINEVLKSNPKEPDLTLSNVLAQRQARRLLKEIDEYFPDLEE